MRVALITGAAGGIGRALCQAFEKAGYRVLATDREQPQECNGSFVAGDLARFWREPEQRTQLVAALRRELAAPRLDVLVNNAALQVVADARSTTAADWNDTLATNLLAPFALIQELLPELEAARGSVVNIGSVHAQLTLPRSVCYATSKAALAGMTRALAVELGDEVRVNCIQPGATDTEMLRSRLLDDEAALQQLARAHPLGRIADPSEIAAAAVFLASPEASFVTGACFDVSGGCTARLHAPDSAK